MFAYSYISADMNNSSDSSQVIILYSMVISLVIWQGTLAVSGKLKSFAMKLATLGTADFDK